MTTVPTSPASDETPDDPTRPTPTMGLVRRIREVLRFARHTLRTGEHEIAVAFMDGTRCGMDGGFAAAMGEYNAVLAGQGIDPIRFQR